MRFGQLTYDLAHLLGGAVLLLSFVLLYQRRIGAVINAFAMLAPLEVQEKQALLEAHSLAERTAAAVTLMEVAIAETGLSAGGAPGGTSIN